MQQDESEFSKLLKTIGSVILCFGGLYVLLWLIDSLVCIAVQIVKWVFGL